MSRIEPFNQGAPPSARSPNKAGGEFSRLFSESMARSLGEGAFAPLLPDDSLGYLGYPALIDAADGASAGGGMLIYLLMCMMQEFKNSDLTPLLTAMSALLPAMGAGAVDAGAAIPLANDPGFLPAQAWRPLAFQYISSAGLRSAETLNRVISQFNVESAERYRPRNGNTYCNIFVWDVTRALGCEIPHYVDRANGDPRYYPDIKGAYELDANGVCDWLRRRGADYNWRAVTAAEAQHYANAGYPVVAAWRNNANGPGHVLIVRPATGGYDPQRGVTVAQAGKYNFSYAHITAAMSADKIAQTRYYVHD